MSWLLELTLIFAIWMADRWQHIPAGGVNVCIAAISCRLREKQARHCDWCRHPAENCRITSVIMNKDRRFSAFKFLGSARFPH